MSAVFDDLARRFLEHLRMPDAARDLDQHYLLEITGPGQETHTMLLQEGETEGSLEVYTTVADGSLHPELLEIGLQQNLAAFRSGGNMFAIDREAECALLCGRYNPAERAAGNFDLWLQEYLEEMEAYHLIADRLSRDLLDTDPSGPGGSFREDSSMLKG
ncbi:MAG: hypothetical protein RLZZ436_1205 [Planctomycetota bacterium]